MKVQRNTSCPCGSGKKYKKCCGVTAKERLEAIEPSNSQSALIRKCGDCDLCCLGWLATYVLGRDIHLGHPCPHSKGQGCSIHDKRPNNPCRIFFCAWVKASSVLPEWMMPSRSGVIVLSNRMHWKQLSVDILVSAGKDPDPKFIKWFQDYCFSNNKAFVYQQHNKWFGYGPKKFQLDLAAKVARGEALWDGSLIV